MRAAVLWIGCLIGAFVLAVLLVPEGEVCTLSTLSPDGAAHETQVWVIEGDDLAGGAGPAVFLRAHSDRANWLERLRAKPQVDLQRDGSVVAYTAELPGDESVRAGVNREMAAKYGISDRLLALLVDPARSIPVRLVPDPTRESASREPAEGHARPQ